MARISEVIHVKYNGEVRECALFSAASDIPSPATAREFALNGAKVYGAVIAGNPGSDDGNWVFEHNSTELLFTVENSPLDFTALLTTPYFVRPLVDSIEVGADGGTLPWGDLLSTNGVVSVYGTPDTGYVTVSEAGVSVSANTSSSSRSFTVDVIVQFADGSTQGITVSGTQESVEAEPWLTVTPTVVYIGPTDSCEVEVDSSSAWKAIANASWLKVSPSSGGAGISVLTLTSKAQDDGSCKVTVTNNDGLAATIHVYPELSKD